MDIAFNEEQIAFREEVREFLRDNLPADIADKTHRGIGLVKEDTQRWQRILHDRGWAAPAWPLEYGGTGWDATKRYIFDQTMAEFDTPDVVPFGTQMVGPVIYTFGTEAQKARFLPKILTGEEWWCQGYSEPGSGSDLASLQTKAVREGDDYVVNGTKTWNSLAHLSDWTFCLVRTSREGKQQEGISFLLIDMSTPGIEPTPIISIDTFSRRRSIGRFWSAPSFAATTGSARARRSNSP